MGLAPLSQQLLQLQCAVQGPNRAPGSPHGEGAVAGARDDEAPGLPNALVHVDHEMRQDVLRVHDICVVQAVEEHVEQGGCDVLQAQSQ